MDEITKYIFNNFSHLMTLQEKAAYKSIHAEEKAKHSEGTRLAKLIRERWISSDPEVRASLASGPDVFMKAVCDRLLREHPDRIYFNRCPRCQALARTTKAKQCPKCFFSWHDEA
jgi:hypothetical protein